MFEDRITVSLVLIYPDAPKEIRGNILKKPELLAKNQCHHGLIGFKYADELVTDALLRDMAQI